MTTACFGEGGFSEIRAWLRASLRTSPPSGPLHGPAIGRRRPGKFPERTLTRPRLPLRAPLDYLLSSMLACTFWHWPRDDVDLGEYERLLDDFHAALAGSRPHGFGRSVVFRAGTAPWLPEGRAAYVDWYLAQGSGALDTLNDAAVSGVCLAPHDL